MTANLQHRYDLAYLQQQGYDYAAIKNDAELCNNVMGALHLQICRQLSGCSTLLQQLGLEADDAAQEVLLKFFASETLFNNLLRMEHPQAYLQRSAKNLLLDMGKKQHFSCCPLELEDGTINIAGGHHTELQFICKEDAAAALTTLCNYEEFDVICFLASRYFDIKPRRLAALLQRHGWAALSKATVKSAGNSFDADHQPLLAQLLQRCLHREYDFSAYSEEKLAALITKRCSALKDKVCSQLA